MAIQALSNKGAASMVTKSKLLIKVTPVANSRVRGETAKSESRSLAQLLKNSMIQLATVCMDTGPGVPFFTTCAMHIPSGDAAVRNRSAFDTFSSLAVRKQNQISG
ncbi:hypothetical protein BGZ98_000296 [Dissophora globulifera]|nr:hypothetical protein BGZ98_000296 [Dissophora globulifera]